METPPPSSASARSGWSLRSFSAAVGESLDQCRWGVESASWTRWTRSVCLHAQLSRIKKKKKKKNHQKKKNPKLTRIIRHAAKITGTAQIRHSPRASQHVWPKSRTYKNSFIPLLPSCCTRVLLTVVWFLQVSHVFISCRSSPDQR